MRLGRYSAVLALGCGAAVLGCSSGNVNEPTIGVVPVTVDPSEVVLPLDAYTFGAEEHQTVSLAAWQLIADCVDRFGDRYTASKPSTDTEALPHFAVSHARRYGLASVESAMVNGYRAPQELPGLTTKGGWDPTPEELTLVRGASRPPIPLDVDGNALPDGGCLAEANRQLGSDDLADQFHYPFPDLLGAQTHDLAEEDSRVRVAMRDWSACMERSGYQYRDVWEPINRAWPTPMSDEEVNTATADVLCKHEVNLVGIWSTVEAAYQAQAIEQHRDELDALREQLDAELAKAAQVLDQD